MIGWANAGPTVALCPPLSQLHELSLELVEPAQASQKPKGPAPTKGTSPSRTPKAAKRQGPSAS